MIVVQMLWVGSATDRADPALLGQELLKLLLPHAVPPPQVVSRLPPYSRSLVSLVLALWQGLQ